MKKIILISNLTAAFFISFTSMAYSQDSLKILVFSKYIGTLLDSTERKEYNVLPAFSENFVSAFFYLSPDSQYYGKIKLKSGHITIDSIIKLNYYSILNIISRIQQQEIKKYGIQNDNLELLFVDGTKVENFEKNQTSNGTDKRKQPPPLRNIPIKKVNMSYSELIEKNFNLGISAGLVYNSSDFEGLGEIFNILEENIPEETYKIPKSDLSFKVSSLFRFSTLLIFKKKFFSEVVYSFAPSNDANTKLEYHSFSASIGYLVKVLKNLSPYLSIGFSGSKFTATNYYGYTVNDRSGILESIKIEGNVKGFSTSAGILYNVSENIGFNVFTNYKFYSDAVISSDYYISEKNAPSVNAKAFEIGVSLFITN